MSRKNVSAAVVREWAKSDEGIKALNDAAAKFPGTRGRLDPTTLDVFHKHNKGKVYETASEAEKPTVSFKATILDGAGRKTTREVTITTEAARDLLGHPAGRKGRFNMALLTAAYEAEVA